MDNEPNVISAQVILPSSSGAKIGAETIITAENIAQYTPSADTIAKATTFFKNKGFNVGEVVGVSFSIAGPATLFEEVLKVRVFQNDKNEASFSGANGTEMSTLEGEALKHLPEGVVEAIIFPERLDFGPESY